MKQLTIYSATFLILGSISMGSLAAPVGTTTTFTANTPAKAAEVNANFTAIVNAVDANDTAATAHIGDTTIHQTKYTDAEAAAAAATPIATHDGDAAAHVGAFAAHSANAAAHHAAYTDAMATTQATAVVGTHDADAAAHGGVEAAYGTHAANAAAHHTAYNDAAAVAAVKAADGAGSTIDADFLDGLSSAAFALSTCPGDMVAVGSICIDKYEAHVTTDLAGTTPATFDGVAGTDVGTCKKNGSNCAGVIFAQSVITKTPSTDVTWFQAAQACASVGKRLPTNAEWQMAVAGTPNGGSCVSGGVAVTTTGSLPACVSTYGAFDMVGNVLEWVADWMLGGNSGGNALETTGLSGTDYNDNRIITTPSSGQQTNSTNMPAGILRGGSAATPTASLAGAHFFVSNISPALVDPNTGFRCAK